MKRDDQPLFLAILAVAFAGLCVVASNLIGEPIHPESPDTIWIAVTGVFTVVLAVSTIGLWIATYKAGKRADSVISTAERAYVKMSHTPPGLRPDYSPHIAPGTYLITVEVTNFGHTPAKVTGAMVKDVVLPVGTSLPPRPDYTPPPGWQEPKAFLVTNDTFSFTRRWGSYVGIEGTNPTHEVYAIGYVDYEDAFGRRYRAGYARLYKPTRNTGGSTVFPTEESRSNLVFVTQEGYNYDICLDDPD